MANIKKNLINFVNNLKGSKINLCQTYYHIPVTATIRNKTTVAITLGNYCFNMMPFDLFDALSTFVSLMSKVKDGLVNVFVYMDDAIIYNEFEEDHWEHLQVVFQRLSDYRLTLNLKKCLFGKKMLDFLGHPIT